MKTIVSILSGLGLALAANSVLAKDQAKQATVTGEVLDLGCYLEFGASGASHAGCARKCIQGGRPVGLKSSDQRIFLLIGAPETLNNQLAPFAAKTVTVTGKVVYRDGINAIENAQLVNGPQ
jgi:hypothetical protein